MKHHPTFSGALLVLVSLCGCFQPAQPPPELSQRLAQADRILATNQHLAFGLTITGEEVGSVARAISSAKHDQKTYDAVFGCEVQFYAGTNFLTAIRLQDHLFWAEKTQYTDDTGVLKAFYEKWEKEAYAK